MLGGCLVCVICTSNNFYSIIFKLCIMIVHTLKMYTFIEDVQLSYLLRLLDMDILSIRNAYGVSDKCNLKLQQFSFLHIQTLYVMIVHTLNMCTLYFVHIL